MNGNSEALNSCKERSNSIQDGDPGEEAVVLTEFNVLDSVGDIGSATSDLVGEPGPSFLAAAAVDGVFVDGTRLVLSVDGLNGAVPLEAVNDDGVNSFTSLTELQTDNELLDLSQSGTLVTSEGLTLSTSQAISSSLVIAPIPATNEIITEKQKAPEVKRKNVGGWPKGKKRKPESTQKVPKAPMSAYVIYARQRREQIVKFNPKLKFTEITRMIGKEWSSMSDDLRKPYFDAADQDKQRYIVELNDYQKTDAYRNYLKRNETEKPSSEDVTKADQVDPNKKIEDFENDGLSCKVCEKYFTSAHNSREHFFGKQHLLAVTRQFEKYQENQLKKKQQEEKEHHFNQYLAIVEKDDCKDATQDQEGLEERTAIQTEEKLSLSQHGLPRINMDDFIQLFLQQNNDREKEINCLRKCVESRKEIFNQLIQEINDLKVQSETLEQHTGNLKALGAALAAQIDTLRMVPTLFGVINF